MEYYLEIFIISFCLSHLAESIGELLPENNWFFIPKFILECKSCFSFWFTLFYSSNLLTACIIWTSMFVYQNLIEPKIKTTL